MLQLSQVSEALKVCTNDTERASLENLKCDLEEILELTRETLNELKGPSNPSTTCEPPKNDEEDPYAQEMAIFLAEINNFESSTSKSADNLSEQVAKEMEKFKVIFEYISFQIISHDINMDHFSCVCVCLYILRLSLIRLSEQNVRHRIHSHGEQKAIIMH